VTLADVLGCQVVDASVVRPGDILVFRLPKDVPPAELEETRARIVEYLVGVRVMVVAGDVAIEVYRPEG
jgi:hypothetical protein